MTAGKSIVRLALAAAAALLLGACAYDYLQHSDRVAYSAGDAVRANLEGANMRTSRFTGAKLPCERPRRPS